MKWGAIDKDCVIEYLYKEKEVRIMSVSSTDNSDFFFCRISEYAIIFYSGCRSPPTFDLKFLSRKEKTKWIKTQKEIEINVIPII